MSDDLELIRGLRLTVEAGLGPQSVRAAQAIDVIERLTAEVANLKAYNLTLANAGISATERAEAAEAEVTKLREVIEPFCNIKADDGDDFSTYDDQVIIRCEITAGDLKRARKAFSRRTK